LNQLAYVTRLLDQTTMDYPNESLAGQAG